MKSKVRSAVATTDSGVADAHIKPTAPRTSTPRNARDPAHTIAIAESAIAKIKSLQLPADPPGFELWYNYVSSQNPAINQSINEKLAQNGLLSIAEVDQIYEQNLSPTRLIDAVDSVGERINIEVGQIAALMRSAISSTTENQRHFETIEHKLKSPIDHKSLGSIVDTLIMTTKKVEEENSALEAKLRASQHEIESLQSNLNIARLESVTDPLTQLANRKYFDRALAQAITDFGMKQKLFSLLLCDIDHFKRFNDTFGHLVGDQVLRLVASTLKRSIKGQDIAARYGGEEFAILLPATDLPGANSLGETIRQAVMSKQLEKRSTGEKLGRVTISIGVAHLQNGDTIEKFIARADKCLYAAKHKGRNQVVSELAPESASLEIGVADA